MRFEVPMRHTFRLYSHHSSKRTCRRRPDRPADFERDRVGRMGEDQGVVAVTKGTRRAPEPRPKRGAPAKSARVAPTKTARTGPAKSERAAAAKPTRSTAARRRPAPSNWGATKRPGRSDAGCVGEMVARLEHAYPDAQCSLLHANPLQLLMSARATSGSRRVHTFS